MSPVRRASLLLLLATGCGVATKTRPTPLRAAQLEAAMGGPAGRLGGLPLVMPLTSVGASYGFHERADLSVHLHPTALLAFNTVGVDVGSTLLIVQQGARWPAVALTGRGYVFTDFSVGALWYADATVAASWRWSPRLTTFVSGSGQVQFVDRRFAWAVGIGNELTLGRLGLSGELRWYDPHTTERPAEWVSPTGRGAVGAVGGITYRFQ